MLAVFEEASEEHRRHGSIVLFRFAVVELMGLVSGAWTEWIAKTAYAVYHSNSSYINGRCLPDERKMLPSGASRGSYYLLRTAQAKMIDPIDEGEMCVNVLQRFTHASPLRRLFILICGVFLPIHQRMGGKTRGSSRHR